MKDLKNAFGFVLFLMLLVSWYFALFVVPEDIHQGEVYRIIYVHVPSAFTAFFLTAVLFFYSLKSLITKKDYAIEARGSVDIALLFTILTLITGSIWGKPTWGVWWTWDARLTTTLLLAILLIGYILLWRNLETEVARSKACALMGVLVFIDVPIIYKSVSWWRTLHQPYSLFQAQQSVMSSEIKGQLIFSICCALFFGIWLMWQRTANLKLAQEVDGELEKLRSEH